MKSTASISSVKKHSNMTRRTKKTSSSKERGMHLTKNNVASFFLSLLDKIKMYHWNTKHYSQHIATDGLYTKLSEIVDKFVEIYMGGNHKYNLTHFIDLTDGAIKNTHPFVRYLEKVKQVLSNMEKIKELNKNDLLSLRDDMLVEINQTLYLFTLK